MAVATGIEYQIAPPQIGPLFIAQSNNLISINWTGPGTLQYSPSLAGGGLDGFADGNQSLQFSSRERTTIFPAVPVRLPSTRTQALLAKLKQEFDI